MSLSPDQNALRFVPAGRPVREPVTKFGGQPVWLDEPSWPLSARLGRPMRFLGQVRLPGEPARLAYLFLTDDIEEHVDGTWEPEAGENACFCSPGRVPDFLTVAALQRGPTFGEDHLVELVAPPEDADADSLHSRIGGVPGWLQDEETPAGAWRFLTQLDSVELPFDVNFGDAGVAYAFVDDTTGEGRFLWQCS
ncbi:protein of unknown function (DUF1963) [Streptoalloteichus tenebrarius]|uniref:DUF1963 domain-containing protein n=1 Tax=Streptoalloteichus tenebrarius (strain ATCC 17920 / DSM 40477 / JCM 4838 / CBS 697.72 / NBRC 16177 / NCIMB 11028 / NRRL B-12390 / A12253. 1 / ISP 5477) TaxID=1933 RepID=A0ABT1I2X4_STRSD|nr:DUF1963 domain-containing protein [Streptoalloteichus tenebrarius]MCP2262104.1 protein of unknown function (DUF1963) [Streptoalloteichus tenebrarius]BFF02258.1 hypothetical protein GCM10020241_39330 [Streptoalloteichus tenebrarius]